MRDNRNYIWDNEEISQRPEYPFIEKWISDGAKVIDLGCGNGSLLQILKEKKNISEFGIEISESGVILCKKKGLNVRQGRIDIELDIPDNSFDFAICNVTIQMVLYPEITLKEMKRISKFQIISFPNFAFFSQRLELFLTGRMPRRLLYRYNWYNTGHIHQLSIKDFRETISTFELNVKDYVYLGRFGGLKNILPNLFASEAIFLLEKK
jgi:methionine biosynthesis protein MetW